jgi:hypothetical protein
MPPLRELLPLALGLSDKIELANIIFRWGKLTFGHQICLLFNSIEESYRLNDALFPSSYDELLVVSSGQQLSFPRRFAFLPESFKALENRILQFREKTTAKTGGSALTIKFALVGAAIFVFGLAISRRFGVTPLPKFSDSFLKAFFRICACIEQGEDEQSCGVGF